MTQHRHQPYSELKWRLIAIAAGAACLSCGADAQDTTGDTRAGAEVGGDETDGATEDDGESDDASKPGDTETSTSPQASDPAPKPGEPKPAEPRPADIDPPEKPPVETSPAPPDPPETTPIDPTPPMMTPEPEPLVCEFGNPATECFNRERLVQMVRIGYGQIPLDPPRSDEEVEAAFLDSGCVKKDYVGDGCCNPAQTEGVLEQGLCCYSFCTGACCGRPLLVDGCPVTAAAIARTDWLEPEKEPSAAQAPARPSPWQQEIADAWRADALMEHASIASFSRFSMDLLAAGAPAELVSAAQQAALDEISHARLCFSLAERFDGKRLGPGPMDLAGVQLSQGLLEAVTLAVREGCVGETIASLLATEQQRRATDPVAAIALEKIAEDEARHAELAWRFVAWALSQGDEHLKAAVRETFAQELSAPLAPEPESWSDEQILAFHAAGRLSPREMQQVQGVARLQVLKPAVEALLGASRAREPVLKAESSIRV